MTELDKQALRRLVDAVPALPWRFEQMHISKFGIRDDHGYIAFLETRSPVNYGSDPDREARARFLGAMTPDTVRALLDEIERLVRRDQMLAEVGCEYCGGSGHVSRIDGEYLGVCDQCPAYELNCTKLERDQLKAENEALRKEAGRMFAEGRNQALDDASTLCSRMAYDAYYPKGSRYKAFTPKHQKALGNILIAACNRIAELPDGPYQRHVERQAKKAGAATGKSGAGQ